jgi:hypothetical protein
LRNAAINRTGSTYIYIAIRRGPMKVPTTGTSVFSPLAVSNATGTQNTTGFPVDLQLSAERNGAHNTFAMDRLRGVITTPADIASPYLQTNTTSAEASSITSLSRYWNNTGFETAFYNRDALMSYWSFRRAPGFFDEVCYTGTGVTNRAITHNLNVIPELIICKSRSSVRNWAVLNPNKRLMYINENFAEYSASTSALYFGDGTNVVNPTSTQFTVGSFGDVNASGSTYVAYLFATCPGVSKCGSYTGLGTDVVLVDCGFTGGARFVMIKRTDASSGWYVWDSARGIVYPSPSPYLFLNSTAAEVQPSANPGFIETYSAGFAALGNSPTASEINVSGATYIFLAIA